jgi:anti-sigma B factor antagonist
MAVLVGSPARSTAVPGQADSDDARRSVGAVAPGARETFVAATEQLDNGTPVVSVTGEVDIATALEFEQTLLGVTEDRAGEVIVDLTDCSFLDCIGLRALIATKARLERSNRSLALVLSNPSVLKIFQITHFDELFQIYPSLAAAAARNGNGNGNRGRGRARGRPWVITLTAQPIRRQRA